MIDVKTSVGRIVALTDEEAIAQYEALTKARWDELRADTLKMKIMDSYGNVYDPGPYPIFQKLNFGQLD